MRRVAAALVVAVLGLLSLGSPTLADDRFQRNLPQGRIEQRHLIEERRVIERHPAIVQQQQRIIEQRRIIEQHRAIAQQQQRIIEQRRIIEQQRRERFASRPFIRDPDPFQRRLVIRPRDRFFDDRIEDRIERRRFIERRERLGFRPVIPNREFFPRRHFVEHDRRVFVFGSTLFLYPAPLYPYPAPGSQMLLYQPPDVVVPAWAVPDSDVCQDFHGDAIIRDTGQPFYGTACLQPDGQWHIVAG